MKTNYIAANSRGKSDYGWLKTFYTYSFANYYDPKRMGFGKLRVLNDDIIAAGRGFSQHPHDNMEIITIPLEGELAHLDSIGNKTLVTAGEVQAMSAGNGVVHSEMNPSANDPVKLFQIWIETREQDIEPQYSQKKFEASDRNNQWQLVVCPDTSTGDVVKIHQDAWIYLGDFDADKTIKYQLKDPTKNGIFLMVINGKVQVDEQILLERDALEIVNTKPGIALHANQNSQALLIEVPLL